jgi:hypothetical protein
MSDSNRGRFPKGVSGNPKGRPRSGEALAEYIRQLAGPDGRTYVDTLHALAVGKHHDTRSRLTAIAVLLERGFGKPPQALEHQLDGRLSLEQLIVASRGPEADEG